MLLRRALPVARQRTAHLFSIYEMGSNKTAPTKDVGAAFETRETLLNVENLETAARDQRRDISAAEPEK
jgi:hypothetical protein